MKSYKVPQSELDISFSRSSGKGGQNVNKVNTKATLKWNLTNNKNLPLELLKRFRVKFSNKINSDDEVVISSEKFRVQAMNVEDCKCKLQAMIDEVAAPPKKRKKTKVPKRAKKKRLENKRKQSEKKAERKKKYY